MKVTDYYQLDDLHLVRYRERPADSSAVLYVSRDFRVQFAIDGKTITYTVPAGTPTDFASIPQAAQAVISKIDAHIEAAVVHDKLCIDRGPWPSEVCAEIFREAMRYAGVEPYKRELMYRAVRRFGPQWK